MSFTAGGCSTPLILNDQFRSLQRNGVRSSDLILNDQFRSLRRNGVRSSDLIVCVSTSCPVHPEADRDKPRSADERSESAGVGPKAPAAERSEAAGVGPKGLYEPIALIVRYCFDPERSVT